VDGLALLLLRHLQQTARNATVERSLAEADSTESPTDIHPPSSYRKECST
jgi:hypothetical protein